MLFFFFNDTATTEIYTLSLHDALPICAAPTVLTPHTGEFERLTGVPTEQAEADRLGVAAEAARRSEEHTSELQSRQYLVCRLLLEKQKYPRISFNAT